MHPLPVTLVSSSFPELLHIHIELGGKKTPFRRPEENSALGVYMKDPSIRIESKMYSFIIKANHLLYITTQIKIDLTSAYTHNQVACEKQVKK